MKRKVVLALLTSLTVGLCSKPLLALGSSDHGGIVAVMIAVIADENKDSKNDSTKAPATLKEEFQALNNTPESSKLLQQSAGGSAKLKDFFN